MLPLAQATGAGVIVGVLVLFATIGFFGLLFLAQTRFVNRRVARFLAPLAPLVGGAIEGGNLTGTFHGYPIRAVLVVEEQSEAYRLTLGARPGGREWSLAYRGSGLLGAHDRAWRVASGDAALVQRLTEAGLPRLMEGWPHRATIAYDAREGLIVCTISGTYLSVQAAQFQAHLGLLEWLAQLNAYVNP
ncbi:MAG: hypothetical protein LC793_00800 [Thermomicrobia bacterium]|nr:hypothetical protein [Thermomicrobia bacterium]MCA1724490.1 hypothetical protein [Thermomicrobia bacterium]